MDPNHKLVLDELGQRFDASTIMTPNGSVTLRIFTTNALPETCFVGYIRVTDDSHQ
jgi:hypothetical protein